MSKTDGSQHNERLERLLFTVTDGIVVVNEHGTVLFANESAKCMFGGSNLLGRNIGIPVAPQGTHRDIQMLCNGRLGWAELRTVPIEWEGKAAIAGTFRDITARKEAEDALRRLNAELEQSEARFRALIENSSDAIATYTLDGVIRYISPAALPIFGYQPAELIVTDTTFRALHRQDARLAAEFFNNLICGDSGVCELRHRHRDGSWRWIEAVGSNQLDKPGINAIIVTYRDLTERKEAEERIRHAGLHDPLTGLPNRALIYEYGEHLLAAARRNGTMAAVLFIDLDGFKPVNDTYGHEVGDAVLTEAAHRLQASTRGADVTGRFGGDEFLVLLPSIRDPEGAESVAKNILTRLFEPYRILNLEILLSVSIGIALFDRDGEQIDTLINRADAAMYYAKQCGRNTFQFFSPELEERATEFASLDQRLKAAVSHNEFALYYQAIVNARSAEVVSVEALLRWPHHDIGPERFIPVAEATGLITRIGEWVIGEACRQHKSWQAQGLPPIPIAVNVSSLQFRQQDFDSRLAKTLRDAKVDPACIQVELTESAIMSDMSRAVEVLNRLNVLGVKIALDDFGTGYSSLSYLSRLPINKIKVDKSFVQRLEYDPACRAITEAIIALGRSLKLEIVAEGIESSKELDYLREHGCDQAQGYYFSAPIPADAFVDWWHGRTVH